MKIEQIDLSRSKPDKDFGTQKALDTLEYL